jgi:hypothetical protein
MTQNEQKVNLNLSIQQLNTVMSAIVKLPIEVGLDTFNTIQHQAQQQLGDPTNKSKNSLDDKIIN